MKFRTRRAAAIALGVAFALTGTACSTTTDAPPAAVEAPAFASQHVDAAAFAAAAAEPGVMIIDVRTPEEYAQGHLEGAVNLDVQSGQFEAGLVDLDPTAAYSVYCRSGNRSAVAAGLMTENGFTDVTDLGSLESAAAATGLPVITG